jgi:DNA-binding NarL/FixJ family response regulator
MLKSQNQQNGGAARETRVLLADDHYLVRAGIRSLLESIPGVRVVAEASNGREALECMGNEKLDLVFLDISMPGLNGLEALPRIRKEFPLVPVIILSMHQSTEYAWNAMDAGASGYLLKKDGVAELQTAVKAVLAGEKYVSPGIWKGLLRQPLNAPRHLLRRSLQCLSPRQREVLQLMAEGETTKGIALILKVSDKTVEYHRSELMKCLNIFDVAGLVRFAIRSGLVSLESE